MKKRTFLKRVGMIALTAAITGAALAPNFAMANNSDDSVWEVHWEGTPSAGFLSSVGRKKEDNSYVYVKSTSVVSTAYNTTTTLPIDVTAYGAKTNMKTSTTNYKNVSYNGKKSMTYRLLPGTSCLLSNYIYEAGYRSAAIYYEPTSIYSTYVTYSGVWSPDYTQY